MRNYNRRCVRNSSINLEDCIESVALDDGREIPCDFVVVATSVKPRMEFLAGSLSRPFT